MNQSKIRDKSYLVIDLYILREIEQQKQRAATKQDLFNLLKIASNQKLFRRFPHLPWSNERND